MMRKVLLGAGAVVLLALAPLAGRPLDKGEVAPKIAGAAWIQGGDDAKAPEEKELAGKVVVLEVWAYW